jgi:hypothetical protein
MRQFVLGLLILIATPMIASSDAEDELECEMLVREGRRCVEYVWSAGDGVEKGAMCPKAPGRTIFVPDYENPDNPPKVGQLKGGPVSSCRCNRMAYKDFGIAKRVKYHWCK